jgi:1,2-diacylglycerol 3-beta-galactosyltransferase
VKIEIIYFNCGGGHRAAATALSSQLSNYPNVEVIITNLFDTIDVKNLFKKVTGRNHEDLYNKVLALGWTIGLGPQLKVLQAVIKTQQKGMVKRLRSHWAQTRPDLVVSVIPNFNRAIGESLGMPFFTVITDIADYPPNFWIEPSLPNQRVIAGSELAHAQAIVAGVPGNRVYRVSGMLLRPSFYNAEPNFSTNEDPIGLVMFGGVGSKEMVPIAKRLASRKLILVCGKNEKLARKLRKLANLNHEVLEFVDDVPTMMSKCDYFIGKPGPGSLSEAVHMRLPVIVTNNLWTMPQEKQNTIWVQQNGLGLVLRSFKRIDAAVTELITHLPELKDNTDRMQNKAIFEVPDILFSKL